MLVIREAQFEVFRKAAEEAFVEELAQRIRLRFSETVAGLSEDALGQRIRWGLEWAARCGMKSAEACAAFVLVMFNIGPEFHLHPPIRRILADPAIPAEERMQRLAQALPASEWGQAARAADQSAWLKATPA